MSAARLLVILLVMSTAAHADSGARELAPNRWTDVPRIVAFGDVHGAYAQLVTALQAARVVDDQLNWAGGDTHVVSLGDLIDRGTDSRQVLDLLIKLQSQAPAAGGRVHVVIGNHELMNVTGDLRYVSAGEFAAFAGATADALRRAAYADFVGDATDDHGAGSEFDARYPPGYFGHRAGFAPQGSYGEWLLQQPLMLVLNENVFVHGGLPPLTARMGLEEINTQFGTDLAEILRLGEILADAGWVSRDEDLLRQDNAVRGRAERTQAAGAQESDQPALVAAAQRFVALTRGDLFGAASPNWYRGTARCHRMLELPVLTAALANLGAQRVIMGHTPTSNRRVQQRLDGHALLADTGMLTSYYGGQPAPIVITHSNLGNSNLEILYPMHDETANTADYIHPLQVMGVPPDSLEQLLASAPIASLDSATQPTGRATATIRVNDNELKVLFETDSRQANNQKIAAYRLSRLLNLNLVPVTVAREVDGRNGVLIALPQAEISEATRMAQKIGRSNWCGRGNDYQLMYAFDALIQNDQRTADSMIYNQQNWQLYLIGHGDSFGTGSGLPKYLAGVEKLLPGLLPATFKALTEEQLLNTFGEQLGKRQIRSLLKRRDMLLRTWNEASTQ